MLRNEAYESMEMNILWHYNALVECIIYFFKLAIVEYTNQWFGRSPKLAIVETLINGLVDPQNLATHHYTQSIIVPHQFKLYSYTYNT